MTSPFAICRTIVRRDGPGRQWVAEQARGLEAAGHVRTLQQGRVAPTARGVAAVTASMAALAAIEARWRRDLGERAFAAFASAFARMNLR